MSRMWNPMLETMDRADLRALQVDRFREQVRHAYDHSPFYRRKLDAAGIDPDGIQTFEDVRAVPTTKKGELREAQGGEPFPYGDLLAASPEGVTEYHQTSGTTGEPVRQADSWSDWEWWGDCWATVLWAQGIRPDDRVFFPFSYNVFVAFWAAHYACERIGAEVVPGGNLSSAQRVRKMREIDVTAFASTPTYALRLAEVAREEGFEPTDFAVDTVVCAGEPGASVPGTKARIEEAWGADVYDHAGATEAGAWGFSCDGESVGLHLNEAQFLIEVLDEDGEPVDPGETGEIVITPLNRTAQPYIRFELRDEIGLREGAAVCDCGRTFRFAEGGVLGRLDDLTKVNGVLLAPTAIEDAVRSYDGVSDEYEVIIDDHEEKPDLDVVTVVAEENPETDVSADEASEELRKTLKQTTSITCRIDVVPYESLERPELKADRLDDRRENHV
ncbi:phenylacetate--CoA ligase family protein [Halarchaeum nitratireducens]|uniref:Phenylacetate--CoA ligase n=1 Tax=Halarchaeum nitratireducens TaxID=489913 RepID=A0A830G9N5_9EURY|nr:AMP-binding protein [Halarchaeum nitratireducens]GGN10546.1 phenylacetate--CoA ligase [Halarchaeum nitratireducens]